MISDDDVVEPPTDDRTGDRTGASDDGTDAGAPSPTGGRWRLVAAVAGAALVAVVALLVVQWNRASDAEDARDHLDTQVADQRDARLVAAQFGEAFFTYDFRDVEASSAAVLDLVTDDYARAFEENRLPGVTELFQNTQLSTDGTAQEVFLTEIAESHVRAVVVLDIEATGELETRTLDDLSLVLDLRREGSGWRVDEVRLPQTRILGPDGQPIGGTGAPADPADPADPAATTTTTTAGG